MERTLARETVLVVDDMPENIRIIADLLAADYNVKVAKSGERALEIAAGDARPDLILLDIIMPDMDGYEVLQSLKANPLTHPIPVIFITALMRPEDEERGLQLGAVDYVTKPISPAVVQARVKTHLALYDQSKSLEHKVMERTSELQETQFEIVRQLARAGEFKDNETGLHIVRISKYSKMLGQKIGLNVNATELLAHAAPMHDIGKIGVPDKILLKPGKLDRDEWKVMKRHPQYGVEILGQHKSELLEYAQIIALTHHEKWDGSGYPNRLKGDQIPLLGRIVAVADVFDALTCDRPYKNAWPVDKAIDHIQREGGRHFDPYIVEAFMDIQEDILATRREHDEPCHSSPANRMAVH